MLILTRRVGEHVEIIKDDETIIKAYILGINKNQVKLGIDAEKEYEIHRSEIADRIRKEKYDHLLKLIQESKSFD